MHYRAVIGDNGSGFRALAGTDHDAVWFNNSGLFVRDQLNGMAQEIFVVKIDRGDDGDFRPDDVGSVEAAAEANLVNRELDSVRLKGNERHGGDTLKKRRMRGKLA